jgi:hypothetical protein
MRTSNSVRKYRDIFAPEEQYHTQMRYGNIRLPGREGRGMPAEKSGEQVYRITGLLLS